MSLLVELRDWLVTLPGTAGFRYSMGAWTEQPGRVIALWQDGGRSFIDEDYPLVRVLLVGERDSPQDAAQLLALAESIRAAARARDCAGDYVRATPVGGIVGPGKTTEDRAWVEFTLEYLK